MSDINATDSHSLSEHSDNALACKNNKATTKRIVVAWEILRIVYNVTLLITGIIGSFIFLDRPPIISAAIIIGILANLFFTIGPYSEIILFVLTRREYRIARIVVFVLGLAFSFLLIIVFLFFQQFNLSAL